MTTRLDLAVLNAGCQCLSPESGKLQNKILFVIRDNMVTINLNLGMETVGRDVKGNLAKLCLRRSVCPVGGGGGAY